MSAAVDETFVGAGYAGNEVLAFGPFRLDPTQRTLWEGGRPLRVGSRALEILLALVERAGEIVGKGELVARVWPNSFVEDCTLRVHIATLRKILSAGRSDSRYVQNVSGRGYRFAARVMRVQKDPPATATRVAASMVRVAGHGTSIAYRADNLPAPLTRMVGRTQMLSALAARVPQRRFVTVTGAGGVGKTALALGVAHMLVSGFPQGACFVDLALLAEPRGLPGFVAAALGLVELEADPLPNILEFLRDKSMLVVLDNCEHVIEAAASLVEEVLKGAPVVHVLATSREPLRADGESVYCLDPLATPAGPDVITRFQALSFPALRLFLERAQMSVDVLELEDAEVPLVAQICRRLDGNPLAIELAAAYVNVLGVRGLAASLDQGLHLLIRGRRTALPRHQTLLASLDWSYGLLSDSEQTILRRLAVFAGSFDLCGACTVVADERVAAGEVFAHLANLAAKSLIVAEVTGEKVLYRLLHTPRAYMLEKLRNSGELAQTQRRFAEMRGASGVTEIRQHARGRLTAVGRGNEQRR